MDWIAYTKTDNNVNVPGQHCALNLPQQLRRLTPKTPTGAKPETLQHHDNQQPHHKCNEPVLYDHHQSVCEVQ
jgi:hypothetical protein